MVPVLKFVEGGVGGWVVTKFGISILRQQEVNGNNRCIAYYKNEIITQKILYSYVPSPKFTTNWHWYY